MGVFSHVQRMKKQIIHNIKQERVEKKADRAAEKIAEQKYRVALRKQKVEYAEKHAKKEAKEYYKEKKGKSSSVANQYFTYLKNKKAAEAKQQQPRRNLFT